MKENKKLEEGEISELERLSRYYSRAIQVAAQYAIALEEFVPHLVPQHHYSTTQIKFMRA